MLYPRGQISKENNFLPSQNQNCLSIKSRNETKSKTLFFNNCSFPDSSQSKMTKRQNYVFLNYLLLFHLNLARTEVRLDRFLYAKEIFFAVPTVQLIRRANQTSQRLGRLGFRSNAFKWQKIVLSLVLQSLLKHFPDLNIQNICGGQSFNCMTQESYLLGKSQVSKALES